MPMKIILKDITSWWTSLSIMSLDTCNWILLHKVVHHVWRGCLHHGSWSRPKALKNLWLVVELVLESLQLTPRKKWVTMKFEVPKRHNLRPTLSTDMVQQVLWWERQKRCSSRKRQATPCREMLL